jgi:two-component sensor histidine kinase
MWGYWRLESMWRSLRLIVNELLSNAVRHAFPDNASGMIFISLQKVGDDGYELVVRDNGKGSDRRRPQEDPSA